MARALLVNVDDIGIYSQAVEPALDAISDGVAESGSVMSVCTGTSLALARLRDRPDLAIGVHLTLTRDFPSWRWAALTSGSSIQHDGLLAPIQQREQLLAHARVDEVKTEFRAQIEKVLVAGIRPSHLDWHCLADGGREDIFDATLELADEYGTAVRAWTDYGRGRTHGTGRVVQDQPFVDSFSIPVVGKLEHLLELARRLPDGVTEWALHPAAHNNADPSTVVRTSDYEALMSPKLKRGLPEAGLTVIGHRPRSA